MNFLEVLEKIEQDSETTVSKGARFERLIQGLLLTTPVYGCNKDAKVYLWSEWPYRNEFAGHDSGIDLVVEKENGEFIAVQCKFHRSKIDQKEIASFVATIGKSFNINGNWHKFSNGLLFITDELTRTAEQLIENREIPITKVTPIKMNELGVDWDELYSGHFGTSAKAKKKTIRDYQIEAVQKTHEHFKNHDRGKLIMACGTGKTFTSLRIAEKETQGKGIVLFLAPSIALVGQTLRKWMVDADENIVIHPLCVCSDPSVGKRKKEEDHFDDSISSIDCLVSTDAEATAAQIRKFTEEFPNELTVVFSTYQSIEVIHEAQEILREKYPEKFEFDLTICDEAHRTTGKVLDSESISYFNLVHISEYIKSKRRLYMTATPRLYKENLKKEAKNQGIYLWSMDDEEQFGEEIYRLGFGEAVKRDLLADYKVIILTISKSSLPKEIRFSNNDKVSELSTDDCTKLVGCIEALSKNVVTENGILRNSAGNQQQMMKTAVAFCNFINPRAKNGSRRKGIASTVVAEKLNDCTYRKSLPDTEQKYVVEVKAKHVDGTMSASERDSALRWLKEKCPENECHILTNVRCLSEGVDVPSLDAVIFLAGMESEIDVVQAVGRVMRKSEGKKYGYIIIPVVIPDFVDVDLALSTSDKFKTVWKVIRALKAHDERLDAIVNKIELNRGRPNSIGICTIGDDELETKLSEQLFLQFRDASSKIYAKLYEKLGTRDHWQTWAARVADIAKNHSERIQKLIHADHDHEQAFKQFLNGLHRNINPNISEQEAIDMLAQHIIIKPIFEALFEGDEFAKKNPISIAMQKVLDLLDQDYEEKDKGLLKYYEYVKDQIGNIDNAAGKQKIIKELYGNFFKIAFKKMSEQHGIVYTPIEIVDFMLHSVNDILKKEFGRTLSDENVNIIDPFTGTGTFITRLLQSGLIEPKDLKRKYENEIFANELILLAYYVASVNIESVYHDLTGDNEIFKGICLTDTFQLGERPETELFTDRFPKNSARLEKEVKTPIHVIISNPPYSIGQKNANDNAQNMKYEKLDESIRKTYAEKSAANLKKGLYDSYIRAFRWASDRIDSENGGMVAFITNSGWLDGNSADGFRKCLQEEFSSIYILNLKGDAYKGKKEGGNVFDIKTPVAITILVKNPHVEKKIADIFYADIGDNLKKQEKFERMNSWKSIANIQHVQIIPNEYGDWIDQRSEASKDFQKFIPIEAIEKLNHNSESFFLLHSMGLNTARDSWCYNSSENELIKNINTTIDFYNETLEKSKSTTSEDLEKFIEDNSSKFSWDRSNKKDLSLGKKYLFNTGSINQSMYRPFFKQICYFDRQLNNCVYQLPKIFPTKDFQNLVICFVGKGSNKSSFPIITSCIPCLDILCKTQCCPLYYKTEYLSEGLFLSEKSEKQYAITDFILREYKKLDQSITKEDIFYSVYGFLHSQEYLKKYAADLKRSLPRLPLLSKENFWIFSKAGRDLADLHLNYETIGAPECVIVEGAESGHFEVEKMKFLSKNDKSSIVYNNYITVKNIPEEAYEYVLNGRSAIEWVMRNYQIKIDKASGIKNDPNLWGQEHGNPRYILDVLLGVINISIKTMEIVRRLPSCNL